MNHAILRYLELHFCGDHLKDMTFHQCLKASKEVRARGKVLNQTLSDNHIIIHIDTSKLSQAASTLHGSQCRDPFIPTEVIRPTLLGQGSNFHFPLQFEDGTRWLVRMRRKTWDGPGVEALKINMISEVATLRYLYERGVAVPNAWVGPPVHDLIYFLEDRVPGRSLPVRHDAIPLPLTPRDQTTILSLAKWFIELERVSFNSFGSLTFSNDKTVVGPWIRVAVANNTEPYFLGPFPTAKAMYLAQIDRMIQQTIDGDRYPPEAELKGYLVLLEARSSVEGCKELDEPVGYLKHGDDKGDHYMINEEGEVTSVIDWEWSFITTKFDAFAAPFALTDKPFRKGSNHLSLREQALMSAYETLGRPDLAKCVKDGKKFQRLYEFFRFERDLVPGCIEGMRAAFTGAEEKAESKEEWIEKALERFAGDPGLEVVSARHKVTLPDISALGIRAE